MMMDINTILLWVGLCAGYFSMIRSHIFEEENPLDIDACSQSIEQLSQEVTRIEQKTLQDSARRMFYVDPSSFCSTCWYEDIDGLRKRCLTYEGKEYMITRDGEIMEVTK